jgi:GGDEF domain-containing protein
VGRLDARRCLGIAVRPPSARERLLKDADAAMYRVMRNGGNISPGLYEGNERLRRIAL